MQNTFTSCLFQWKTSRKGRVQKRSRKVVFFFVCLREEKWKEEKIKRKLTTGLTEKSSPHIWQENKQKMRVDGKQAKNEMA